MDPSDQRRILVYATPLPESVSAQIRRRRWSLILIGPVMGLLLGFVDALFAIALWIGAGQPDFYFRGWQGVRLTLFTNAYLGCVAGWLAVGGTMLFESLMKRRIRALLTAWLTSVVSLPLLLAMHVWEFRHKTIVTVFTEFYVMASCVVIGIITSRRPTDSEQ